MVITCGISIVLTFIHRYYCIWDNNRRDKAGIPEGFDHAFEDDSTDLKVRILPKLDTLLPPNDYFTNDLFLLPLHRTLSSVTYCSVMT